MFLNNFYDPGIVQHFESWLYNLKTFMNVNEKHTFFLSKTEFLKMKEALSTSVMLWVHVQFHVAYTLHLLYRPQL